MTSAPCPSVSRMTSSTKLTAGVHGVMRAGGTREGSSFIGAGAADHAGTELTSDVNRR